MQQPASILHLALFRDNEANIHLQIVVCPSLLCKRKDRGIFKVSRFILGEKNQLLVIALALKSSIVT